MSRIRLIIHASDFSKASRRAFAQSIGLAKSHRAELLILHVLSIVPPFGGEGYIAPGVWEQMEEAALGVARRELDKLVQKSRRAGVKAKKLLVLGSPYEEIARVCRRQRADLVVMGTHGRGGIRKFVLGSVADRVVRTSTCPVMTVRGG